ncbi:MAG: hypothetical protein Ct9H300mP28_13610 [Pseudomonadota bacterium]|nr:MAG: hypothetical protein Ct9H300mP28_13610 [Pseudomonadota bacterium]
MNHVASVHPFRSGTSKAIPLMKKDKWDKTLLEELSRTMEDASICGLGQAALIHSQCDQIFSPRRCE